MSQNRHTPPAPALTLELFFSGESPILLEILVFATVHHSGFNFTVFLPTVNSIGIAVKVRFAIASRHFIL